MRGRNVNKSRQFTNFPPVHQARLTKHYKTQVGQEKNFGEKNVLWSNGRSKNRSNARSEVPLEVSLGVTLKVTLGVMVGVTVGVTVEVTIGVTVGESNCVSRWRGPARR